MTSASGIYLSVVSDDFGMCPAVNEGIAQAFTQGVLTDANLMAPCAAFPEAARLAKAHHIPVGIHATFTAEWDNLRWKPLTSLPSMTDKDGTFRMTVEEAWKNADLKEAAAELDAQWSRIEAAGLTISHVSEHMGGDAKLAGLFRKKVRATKVPYRDFTLDGTEHLIPHCDFSSQLATDDSSTDLLVLRRRLKEWLDSLEPGYHMWVVHCAVDDPSLNAICSPTHHAVDWARTYRMIDQSLVLDPEVKHWIEERGIQLISIARVPTIGF